MRRYFFMVVCATLLCVYTSVISAVSAKLDLAKNLNSFTTFQADFSQKTIGSTGRSIQSAAGKVWIKKPAGLRWQLITPSQQLYVVNHQWMWIYDADLMQATVQHLTPSTAFSPALLLSNNTEQWLHQFVISYHEKKGLQVFTLKSRHSNAAFTEIVLSFDRSVLVKMEMVDRLLQTTIFSFKNIKLNGPLAPKLFEFVPPAGVDVVRQ